MAPTVKVSVRVKVRARCRGMLGSLWVTVKVKGRVIVRGRVRGRVSNEKLIATDHADLHNRAFTLGARCVIPYAYADLRLHIWRWQCAHRNSRQCLPHRTPPLHEPDAVLFLCGERFALAKRWDQG